MFSPRHKMGRSRLAKWQRTDTINSQSPKRLRPDPSSEPPSPKPMKSRGVKFLEWQVDPSTGMILSPHYLLPSSPSVLYSPAGVDPRQLVWNPDTFQQAYARMDPLAARELREHQHGQPIETVSPEGNEHYTRVRFL